MMRQQQASPVALGSRHEEKASTGTALEPCQTLVFNVENWVSTLEEADVDHPAMKQLFHSRPDEQGACT